MSLYRAFRGADPDKTALLVARGFIEPPQTADSVAMPDAPARPVAGSVDSLGARPRPTQAARLKTTLKK